MQKRKLTQEEKNELASFLKDSPKIWLSKNLYLMAGIPAVIIGFIVSWKLEIILTVFLLVFLILVILKKVDRKLVMKDLKENSAHIVTGPLVIEEIGIEGKGYWRSYWVKKVLLDKVYSKTEKSKYDLYKQGDILKVEYCRHSGHILKVTKEAPTN